VEGIGCRVNKVESDGRRVGTHPLWDRIGIVGVDESDIGALEVQSDSISRQPLQGNLNVRCIEKHHEARPG
jgi:hypothetical protein